MTAPPARPWIAALILAAGSSRRFGTGNKLLAELEGRPLVSRVIEAAEAAGLTPVVIVTGHEAERIVAATSSPMRQHLHNDRHREGIGTSIAAGVAALAGEVDGVLIAQGDMPALDARLVRDLATAFAANGCDRLVFPRLPDGRQGNPVIWPQRLFAALRALGGDRGGKLLIEAEGDRAVAVPASGPGAEIDIDTPAELAAYLSAPGKAAR